jgi:hypothetical protein
MDYLELIDYIDKNVIVLKKPSSYIFMQNRWGIVSRFPTKP